MENIGEYAMTPEEMRIKKRELGYTNEVLAEKSGIPLGTVQKIMSGATKAPRRDTILSLEKALSDLPSDHSEGMKKGTSALWDTGIDKESVYGAATALREAAPAYAIHSKKQEKLTKFDYYALPKDHPRVELIDGQLLTMESPSRIHQGLLLGLGMELAHCVDKNPGKCFLYLAPSDVEIADDDYNVVQPDLYMHCHPEKEMPAPYKGAPDFMLEILSPSTSGIDLLVKLNLYQKYGVREYWIIDPSHKAVTVFDFENGKKPASYTFDEVVPVSISDGACEVDFRKVYARVAHLY